MKLHLNLSLRRALLAAMAAVATFAPSATAGLVDARYDLQYYLDFGYNMGLFRPGATNITVPFKDGTTVSNATIPLMPNLDSYATRAEYAGSFGGGAGLVSPQYVVSAAHCKEGNVYFVTRSNDYSAAYSSTGYKSQAGVGSSDWSIQRLNKIVTEVAYTPYASDSFMNDNMKLNETWLYRTGQGDPKDTYGGLATGRTPLGGLSNLSTRDQNGTGTWVYRVFNRKEDITGDTRPPLEISMTSGDSGSPLYAWDDGNKQFVHVGFCSGGNSFSGYTGDIFICHNPTAYDNFINSYEVKVNSFTGTDKILWGAQDPTTGKGFLTQGSQSVEYTGAGSGNTVKDHLGLTFSTADTVNTQTIVLQDSVNMGAGAMTFDKGSWTLTEKDAASTFNSAGFIVNGGANLTLNLTASANEEWRKVGEGIMTITGSGDNDAVLRVGGGNTVYNVVRDNEDNIIGCTLGNLGETRLDRDGYAASSIRLEGGVAIIVLMRDNQFKTASGDTFTFGNAGGLLNLNGHGLTWSVINQDGSGKGARIGNFTPLGETTPGRAEFTYTGTGQFDGCFVDESNGDDDGKAQLAVIYKGAADASWKLTGNNTNVGGYTVQSGTMVLEGTPTPHSFYKVSDDWDYARMQGSKVTVKSGAAFQLSHHAVVKGDIHVENGGTFIMNQAVNAASESIGGSGRVDMLNRENVSLDGNVYLYASGKNVAKMEANISSAAVTTLRGNISVVDEPGSAYKAISLTKTGNGILAVTGTVNLPSVEIKEGGLVVGDASNATALSNPYSWYQWTIGEKGFLAANGLDVATALSSTNISASSNGVLALTADQAEELTGKAVENGLYIGAWGDVSYGTAGTKHSLTAYNKEWHLGGGTGTLTVNFKLDGDYNLIIGNEWSSGTVHLTNVNNQIGGDIIIKGTGNRLTYTDRAALGGAGILLTYGNSLMLDDTSLLEAIKPGAEGTIALRARDGESFDLDLSSNDRASLSVGADGDYTYTGNLSVKDTYRFGGSGNLTLDTKLDGSKAMKIDGQGTTGSSVTFAHEDAYTGSITAGGGLGLAEANSRGSIGIHVAHGEALASVADMELQKGATLYMDGQSMEVRNLTAQTGSAICNNGENKALLVLNVEEGTSTSIADGVLNNGANSAALHLIKSGTGTLTMGANASWDGGMTISQGTVIATLTGSEYINAAGGIGAKSATINIEEKGTLILDITKNAHTLGMNGNTLLPQTLKGTGTVVLQSGGEVMFSNQTTAFEGTVQLKDNTRLYIGRLDFDYGYEGYYNLNALSASTIVVESGSQAKVTNFYRWGSLNAISTTADFVISGDGYSGARIYNIYASRFSEGALAIDNQSTVYGSITLADNATITSSSGGKLAAYPNSTSIASDTDRYGDNATYGVKNHLGGIIRGRILGEGKDLTFGGNEGMTITADSANTFRNLIIANGNGHNDDQFALRLDGGKAVSQTSTALGKGDVTLSDGLILRLAGTGTANQTDVEYTYANNIAAGNDSTIQSYNITNKLTGVVTAAGNLKLATAQGGVLNLAGGVSGSGTLNIGAASKVILGDGISSTVTFGGNVVAGAGADFTLESASSLAENSTISGTDSLTLHLSGTADYTLGGITMSGTDSALTLHFDFTQAGSAEYTTLNSSIASTATSIAIDLNMFNDIAEGNYTLINGSLGDAIYTLADTYGDRLSLVVDNGSLTLQVGPESRLYWAADSASQEWNYADNNWLTGNKGEKNAFSGTTEVMFTASGLSTAGTRESITISNALTVGKVNVSSQYELKGEGSLNGTKLAVGDGGDLKLGVNAAFSEGVQVNAGTLTVEGQTLTANVSAENGAEVNLNGATMKGNIMVNSESAVNMDAASITGAVSTPASGSIALTNARLSGTFSTDSGAMVLNAEDLVLSEGSFESSAQLKAGSITVAGGSFTLKEASDIETLAVNAGQTATLYNSAEESGKSKKFGVLQLADNATLAIDNRANTTSESGIIGTLQIGGNATIKETYGSGHLTIDTLTLADGVTSGTINLHKSSTNGGASYTAMFDIGSATAPAGNFVGEVVLANTVSHTTNPKHSVFINLYGKETLAHAVVKMNEQKDSGAYLGLGINADNARIGGLESSSSLGDRVLLFSGYAPQNIGWNTGDGPDKNNNEVARTLIIDTAENAAYTYHGQVCKNLSLVKDGAGKQTFSGNSAKFNGSIEILDGTMAFNGDAINMLSAASSVTVSGGTLDISSYDFSSGSLTVNNFSFSEDSVLALGNLTSGTTYEFFNADSLLDNWTSLTTKNFTIGGTSLSDLGRVSLSLGMDGSFSYSFDSWELTWQGGSTGTWDMTAANEVWQTTRLDEVTGEESTFNTGFSSGDNVTFTDGNTATLGSDILVSTVNVNSGTVVIKDAGSYAFNASTVNVADDAALQIQYTNNNAAANNTLTKLILGNGASFSTYDGNAAIAATTIGQLQLNGASATVKDENHSGIYHIQNLSLKDGLASSELNLVKKSPSKNITVFQLGSNSDAGNFAGTINLKSIATDSSAYGRSAAIILSNKDIAANAVINLESNTSSASASVLALGINADNTTVAGLESGRTLGNKAKLFSGSIGTTTSKEWATGNIDNASTRTLTINTAEGGNYTFNGEVMSSNSVKLNLVKSGKGTQSFLGSGSFGSITVEGGTLTLGGSMTVEVSAANRTFNVAQNARLNISSSATFTNTGEVKLNKTGDGTMTVNSKISQWWLDIRTGTFEVAYTGDDGNSIDHIDAGIDGNATGQVLVKKGAKLTSTAIWMRNASIALEEGGKLIYKDKGATIIGESSSGTAIIERTNKANGGLYSGVDDSNITISNARVKYTGGNATISNKLTNSSVENAGGGVLTVTNTGNTLSGVVASAGDITLQNLAANTSLNLLEIATGCTVNAYVGTQETDKRTITVSSTGTALLSGGATLNTSLTLADGATLEMYNLTADTTVTINGALTFNGQVKMGTKLLAAVNALTGWEESLTLFTGLAGGVSLPAAAATNADEMVRASEVFSNVTNSHLYVTYQVIDNVGSLMVINVPEPTTTTLSLLALSALAARRRRK